MAVIQGQNPTTPPTFLSFNQFQQLLQSKISKKDVELSTLKTILSQGINPHEQTVLGIREGIIKMLKEIDSDKMDYLKKETGLKAKEIKDIIMEHYNELYKGNQYQTPKLMYDLTFGKIKISYEMLEKLCDEHGFDLETKKSDWFKLLQENGKAPHNIKFQVKCRSEAKHITTKTIDLIRNHGCKYCNSRYINQRRTHAICEAMFGKCEEEVRLVEIFEEIGTDQKYAKERDIMDVFKMRIDTYFGINIKDKAGNVIGIVIKDKNGNIIKDKYGNEEFHIGIEAQGPQHTRTERGFKTYLYFNNFNGKEGKNQLIKLRREWLRSLVRDEVKVNAFKNNNERGYYLITVDNDIKVEDRAEHILNELHEQTGIDIKYLADNVNIKEIIKTIL